MKNETTKLDQLTSLRFFAALMIVIWHSQGMFGIGHIEVNLSQGVSFFFVLSGFILTYVYPKLDTWIKVGLFFKARVARIWPAYFACFLLGCWLLSYDLGSKTVVAYLFMIQAWMPLSKYFFSYNDVGWSVSTEFFFYLAFPILIYKWNETWRIKFAVSVCVLIALMILSNYFSLPNYGTPEAGTDGIKITQDGLLYINPLSRIVEFILGMCFALAWKRRASFEAHTSTLWATSYEMGTIMFCIVSMYWSNPIATWGGSSILGPAAGFWLSMAAPAIAFGVLIYVMARGRGAISKTLAHPALVLLGEISFSIYLLHKILLDYYAVNIADFPYLPNPISFGIFLIILLLSSYLMWSYIEMPGRRLIMGKRVIHGTEVMKKSWKEHFVLGRKPLFAAVALCCMVGIIGLKMGGPNLISQKEAEALTPSSLSDYAGTTFGGLFTLRGLDIKRESDGLHVKLAWLSKADQKLSFTNAIHLIDSNNKILDQADYKQSPRKAYVKPGDIWLDTIFIPANKIDSKVNGLAIALFDDKEFLLIDRGIRDWGGRRMIILIAAR